MSGNHQSANRIRRQAWIIWAVFSIAPIFQLFVAWQLTVKRISRPSLLIEQAVPVCIVLSIAAIIAAIVIHRTLPRWVLKSKQEPRSGLLDRFFGKATTGIQEGEGAAAALAASNLMIFLYSLSLSCVTYGLIIVLLDGELWNMIPFVFVSLVLQAIFRPDEAFFRRVEEKFGDGRQSGTK